MLFVVGKVKKNELNRDKWLHVRVTEEEFSKINRTFLKTAFSKRSDFLRAMLLAKPVVKAVRNESLQDIYSTLFLLRKDLNGIANNFNQAVHKLHVLDHTHQVKAWVLAHELLRRKLIADVEEIKVFIAKTAEKWLQS